MTDLLFRRHPWGSPTYMDSANVSVRIATAPRVTEAERAYLRERLEDVMAQAAQTWLTHAYGIASKVDVIAVQIDRGDGQTTTTEGDPDHA